MGRSGLAAGCACVASAAALLAAACVSAGAAEQPVSEPARASVAIPRGSFVTSGAESIELVEEPSPALYPQLIVAALEIRPVSHDATITLPYTNALVRDWNVGDETKLGIFERSGDDTWRWMPALVDATSNIAVTHTMHAADATAWTVGPSWMMMPWQQRTVLGAQFVPGKRNALVIHGWNSEPWDNCMLRLTAGIAPAYDNVAALAYPSALDIVENANWLRGKIEDRWPDVPFDIIAFSEGGLVARAAIEPRAWNGNDAIAAEVERLIMIATPHEGLLAAAPPSALNDVASWQMRPGSEFLRVLNAGPQATGVAYHLIAGDMGAGHDTIVPVDSALARNVLRPASVETLRLPHIPPREGARALPCDEQVYEAIRAITG